MVVTNRYAKRLLLVDELIKLKYDVSPKKISPRKKSYIISKDNIIYRMDFNTDWVTINQDQDKLYCGINLSSGKRLSKCMDSDLTKLFNDITKILYQRTDIKTPKKSGVFDTPLVSFINRSLRRNHLHQRKLMPLQFQN
jgi:hypothetical protein